MKRFFPIFVGLLSIAIIIFIGRFIQNRKSSTADVQTDRVIKTTLTKSIQSSGKTKAKKAAELKFQTSGKLSWVGVSEGDKVTPFQVIARLDSREVEKNLQKTLADYSLQRNDFDSTQQSFYNMTPDTALNDSMKRILQNNQWDLNKAIYDVELKNLTLEYSSLVTPIGGIVSHIDTPVAGVNITPASATFTIIDPESLLFEANIDEIDVGNLEIGQSASIALDAFPDATFSGKVSYISYSSVLSGGGATVFPVQITFDTPEKLRVGLNGDVTITSLILPDVLVVPIEAIREDGVKKFVYRKIQTRYEKIYVTTGEQNDTYVAINSGLTPGDTVVIKGFSNIHVK
jgi:RND family efflux transporter MFP subunit